MVQQLEVFFKQKCFDSVTCSLEKEVSANHLDLITIGRNMNYYFSRLPIMKTVTHVIIENQISPIANRMKTIQGMVAQYFIILGVKHIEFVSSSNKLKDFHSILGKTLDLNSVSELSLENSEKENSEKEKEKKTYKKNKSDGILFCSHYLNTIFKDWKMFFESYPKKKDDLADCFLQGFWYIQKNNISYVSTKK
jgi:hypothetical protein